MIVDRTMRGVEELLGQFDRFGVSQRGWCNSRSIAAYVRVTSHVIYRVEKFTPTIDVANILVPSARRGKGIFTKWLGQLENLAKKHNRAVYVESINNTRLYSFLLNRGYTKAVVPNCLVKEIR